MTVSQIDQRLAASLQLRQVQSIARADGIATKLDTVFSAALKKIADALTSDIGEVAKRVAYEELMRLAILQSKDVVGSELRSMAEWSHESAARAIMQSVPLDWLMASIPEETIRGYMQIEQIVPPKRFVNWNAGVLTFGAEDASGPMALGIPLGIPAYQELSDEEKQELAANVLFPPPTVQQVEKALLTTDYERRLDSLSGLISDKQAAVNELITGYAAGEDIRKLRKRMDPLVGGIRASAQRIARTEAMRVAEQMQRENWEALGDMMTGVQLLATLDANTRPEHATRNGTIYYRNPKGSQRPLSELPNLPDAPNCRCWSSPVLTPPDELFEDPELAAALAPQKPTGVPDPASYEKWFETAKPAERKIVVGVRRYTSIEAMLGRTPEWSDFIDEDGKLLPLDVLMAESVTERTVRKKAVQKAMAERAKAIQRVSFAGFEFPKGLRSKKKGKAESPPKPKPMRDDGFPDPSELKKIKDLPGSTRPWLGESTIDQKQWVVKSTASGIAPDHLRSEALADDLYRVVGLGVPKGVLVETNDGPVKITEFLRGETLAQWKRGKTKQQIDAMHKEIQKGFVADALFANHDVIGLSDDNVFVMNGKPLRIDNGGALAFRAQGAAKSGWGPTVSEIDTLRNPTINSNTAAAFGSISEAEIKRQVQQIDKNKKAILATVKDPKLRATIEARIADLRSKYLEPNRDVDARELKPRSAIYTITKDAVKRVKKAKSNGVTIAGDHGDVEDHNVIVWQEKNASGKVVTRVQMKLTQQGSKKVSDRLRDGDITFEKWTEYRPGLSRFVDGGEIARTGQQSIRVGENYEMTLDGVKVNFIPNKGQRIGQTGLALQGTVSIEVEGDDVKSIEAAKSAVKRLGVDLAPPTREAEEALYLHRGFVLRKLDRSVEYQAIWGDGSLSEADRVQKLKDYAKRKLSIDVSKIKHYNPPGESLAADGSGVRHFQRWDISPEELRQGLQGHALLHTTGSLYDSPSGKVAETLGYVLDSGGEFLSTGARTRKGVSIYGGASPEKDIQTGGASYLFTRIKNVERGEIRHGYYFKVENLLKQDHVSLASDEFGAIAKFDERAADIEGYKAYARGGSNETIFKEGLSVGDIDFIVVRPHEREGVLKVFRDRGVTKMPDGRRIEDIVKVNRGGEIVKESKKSVPFVSEEVLQKLNAIVRGGGVVEVFEDGELIHDAIGLGHVAVYQDAMFWCLTFPTDMQHFHMQKFSAATIIGRDVQFDGTDGRKVIIRSDDHLSDDEKARSQKFNAEWFAFVNKQPADYLESLFLGDAQVLGLV